MNHYVIRLTDGIRFVSTVLDAPDIETMRMVVAPSWFEHSCWRVTKITTSEECFDMSAPDVRAFAPPAHPEAEFEICLRA
jgi:hypothetical protein